MVSGKEGIHSRRRSQKKKEPCAWENRLALEEGRKKKRTLLKEVCRKEKTLKETLLRGKGKGGIMQGGKRREEGRGGTCVRGNK